MASPALPIGWRDATELVRWSHPKVSSDANRGPLRGRRPGGDGQPMERSRVAEIGDRERPLKRRNAGWLHSTRTGQLRERFR